MTKHAYKQIFMALALLFATPAFASDRSPLALVLRGEYDQARDALVNDLGNTSAAALHRGFLEAHISRHKGDMQTALKICRTLLTIEPRFDPARQFLTAHYRLTGNTQSAAYHARMMMNVSPDAELRRGAETYLKSVSFGKRQGAEFRFSFKDSDNINKGSTEDTVETTFGVLKISPQSRAISSSVVKVGTTAWVSHDLDELHRLKLSLNIHHAEYSSNLMPDQTTGDVSFSIRRPFEKGAAAAGWKFKKTDLSTGRYLSGNGPTFDFSYRASPKVRLTYSLEFLQQTAYRNTALSGRLSTQELGVEIALHPDWILGFNIPIEDRFTQRKDLDYSLKGIVGSVSYRPASGLNITGEFGETTKTYGAADPILGVRSKIMKQTAMLKVSHSAVRIGRFVPEITFSAEKSASNNAFSNYERQDVTIGISGVF